MNMLQKRYAYRIPWWDGLTRLLVCGLILILICAMAYNPKVSGAVKSDVQYIMTRLYLMGWCYYISYVVFDIIFKPVIIITGSDITIPLFFPFWERVIIPFAAIESIRAVKATSGPKYTKPALLMIKFKEKEYKISQWCMGAMSNRTFFECIHSVLENVQSKRPDLANACHSVHITLPKLDEPLPPPYKPNKLFIAILVILLTPVFFLIAFIIFGAIKHWLTGNS